MNIVPGQVDHDACSNVLFVEVQHLVRSIEVTNTIDCFIEWQKLTWTSAGLMIYLGTKMSAEWMSLSYMRERKRDRERVRERKNEVDVFEDRTTFAFLILIE